ncbi:MAG: cation-efflux pump [Actinomycetota bacterium]|nr:cation-efflux pump [Actinomycetota bacterium]
MQIFKTRRGEQAVLWALIVSALLAVSKLVVWALTSSLVVLSQALDSILDVVILILLFVSLRVAAKPADESHHYGHRKAENLAALLQTIFLALVLGAVAKEAVERLISAPTETNAPWYAIALLGASLVIDFFRARLLASAASEENSEALRAGALNMTGDVATAIVALLALGLVRAGLTEADALGSLVVSAGVAAASFRVVKRSIDVLMDRAPTARAEMITEAAGRVPGVTETRRVRTRGNDKELFVDVTVATSRTASLERAHDVAEGVEREISRVAPGSDVVVHVEPGRDGSDLMERVSGAASRVEGIQEVHNVLIHESINGLTKRLHVTLHAKAGPGTLLQDAHRLSDRVETAVLEELGPGVRVDTHIEPLQPSQPGRDVTRARQDVVHMLRDLVLEQSAVLGCHDVLVTSVHGHLSVVAHVTGEADLPLDRIHEASRVIERSLRENYPEVGPVLIHFEPANPEE